MSLLLALSDGLPWRSLPSQFGVKIADRSAMQRQCSLRPGGFLQMQGIFQRVAVLAPQLQSRHTSASPAKRLSRLVIPHREQVRSSGSSFLGALQAHL